MRKFSLIIPLILLVLISCTKNKKEIGIPIYVEVEQMDPELEKCFSDKLYKKWAGLNSLEPHSLSEKPNEKNIEDVHVFKSYDEFDMDKDKPGTEKLMVNVYGDGDTATTFFQVQRYELIPEGLWQRKLNLGNFRVQDRPNDTKNPGKLDTEEICDMMVHICILASFK